MTQPGPPGIARRWSMLGEVNRCALLCAGVAAAAAFASSCAAKTTPQSAPVREAGAIAATKLEGFLSPLHGSPDTLGSAAADGCAGGQDNWVIRDDFEFFCMRAGAVALGLPATTPSAAAAAADELLSDAFRTGRRCPAPPRFADTELGGLSAAAAGRAELHLDCGDGLTVELRLQRSADASSASALSVLPSAPEGTVLEAERLDGPAVAAASVSAGRPYLLVVHARLKYHVEPRV